MARLTVEDCMTRIGNRYELVLLASERARQINRGAPPLIDSVQDKAVVTALREIASGDVTSDNIRDLTRYAHQDEEELEGLAFPSQPPSS